MQIAHAKMERMLKNNVPFRKFNCCIGIPLQAFVKKAKFVATFFGHEQRFRIQQKRRQYSLNGKRY